MHKFAFVLIAPFLLIAIATSKAEAKCRDVIDIYYPKDFAHEAYDRNCPYTKTEINCKDCGNVYYISRKGYKRWADEYLKLGMQPPYPERTDTEVLFPPTKLSLKK